MVTAEEEGDSSSFALYHVQDKPFLRLPPKWQAASLHVLPGKDQEAADSWIVIDFCWRCPRAEGQPRTRVEGQQPCFYNWKWMHCYMHSFYVYISYHCLHYQTEETVCGGKCLWYTYRVYLVTKQKKTKLWILRGPIETIAMLLVWKPWRD